MIAEFISKFEGISHAKDFLEALEHLSEHFATEYFADGNARNAMIDSLIQYLITLKEPNASIQR